ncbi:MAG: hypothetical protein ACYTGW_04985 [Planctomycetota bacterium]|jgi:ATP-dependent protease HslVU (ClpYQ) peptidase subunit
MSILVAVRKGKTTVVAADTLTTFGSHKHPSHNHAVDKVRRVGTALMGASGWEIYNDILDDYVGTKRAPSLTNEKTIFKFFVKLWSALRDRYNLVNDQCHDRDTPFGNLDASFLIANRRGIYMVSGDLSISRFEQYAAIGSGADYALGALYHLYDQERDAATIARKAVETAIQFNVHCGGDVRVVKV